MKDIASVTPKFMKRLNQGDSSPWTSRKTDYTGIKFSSRGRTYFSCSCGETGKLNDGDRCCPKCGGSLTTLHTEYSQYNVWKVRETSPSSWKATYCIAKAEIDPVKKEYHFVEKRVDDFEFSLPYTLQFYTPVSRTGQVTAFDMMKYVPQFDLIRKLTRWQQNSNRQRDFMTEVGNALMRLGVSVEEVEKDLELYTLYFAHSLKRGPAYMAPTLDSYLKEQGLSDEGVKRMKVLAKTLWPNGYSIANFAYTYENFQNLCANVQSCLDEEYPNSGLILDLLSRSALSLDEFDMTMRFFNTLSYDKQFKLRYETPAIKSSEEMVQCFADFFKKNSARKQSIVYMFKERATKLRDLGYPIVLENLLDKNYYRLVNMSAYSSKSENFDEEFNRDPLQCMKGMK